MDFDRFSSAADYVGFAPASSAVLRAFHPVAEPHFARIIDDFYDTIQAHPRASAVITGGEDQIERLKQTLIHWLDSVLLGPHDAAFVASHARIGHVHVRIGLPQEFMFTAMNRIRSQLRQVAEGAYRDDPASVGPTLRAVDQILDLELAIMLDTYRVHMEDRMRTQERLATIGQLAASIGHELRNPLGIIESSLFLVRQRLERAGVREAGIDKHLDKIGAQVRGCGKTITDLLELARSRPPRRQKVDVVALLDHAVELAALGADVIVTRAIEPDLALNGDPDQMRQVVTNLIANAAQAMDGRGAIQIGASTARSGVELWVQDEGPGVTPEHRDHVFDALFTTKPKGTGLGLALCRRIVEAHGGEIVLEPSPRGARFRVWIPHFGNDD